MDYDLFAQGHSGIMAHMREDDRAKGIQAITDQMNQHFTKSTENEDKNEVNINSDTNTAAPTITADILHVSPKKRTRCEVEKHDDWGLDHIHFNAKSSKIKWSEYEKQYISNFTDKHSSLHDKWDKCLQNIWQADGSVRRQFHLKHISKSSNLRGAIRSRK